MPTYSYRCKQCQAVQSALMGIHDDLSPACETCGGLTERIIGQAPTVISKEVLPVKEDAPSTQGSACVLHHHHSPNCNH